MAHTNQFEKTEDHDRIAFKGYVAIWNQSPSQHVLIGAPTKERLALYWKELTELELDYDRAQKVLFVEDKDGR